MEGYIGREIISDQEAIECGRNFANTLKAADSSPEILKVVICDFIETYKLLNEDGNGKLMGVLIEDYLFPTLRILNDEGHFDRDLNLFLRIFTDEVITELNESGIMYFLDILNPGTAADIKCVRDNEVMRRLEAFDFDADYCWMGNLSLVDGFDRLTKRTEQRLENVLIEMLRRMFLERKMECSEYTYVEELITEAKRIHPDSLNDRIGYYCWEFGRFENIRGYDVRRFDLALMPLILFFRHKINRRTGDKALSAEVEFRIGAPVFPLVAEYVKEPLMEYTFDYNGGVAECIAEGIWKRICAVQDDES